MQSRFANRHRPIALLSASLLFLASGSVAASEQTESPVHAMQIARTHLELQPGDDEAYARGLANPMRFVSIKGVQEFSGTLLVRTKDGHLKAGKARIESLITQKSLFVDEYAITVPAGIDEGQLAAMLMSTGDYEFAQPNWNLYPTATPNDPFYSSSTQHINLQSEAAWDLNTGDPSVIVAIIDTGVDITQPDLQNAMVPGYNSIQRLTQAEGADLTDVVNHGTFVAGCAAARGNNSVGVTGVGWNFSIMPVRVVSNGGSASVISIGDGARWAGENGAKVVNISFAGVMNASNISLGNDLKENGALLVYAAGNDNVAIAPDRPSFVVVSSTDQFDIKAGNSNHGEAIDVAAPGVSIFSTRVGVTYGAGSGTSFAAGIASGVCAMIYSVNPDFGPDDVQEILYASVDDIGDPGEDNLYGHGRVNTFNAIVQAQSYTPRFPIPLAESFEDSSWMDLLSATSGSVTIANDPSAPDGPSVLVMDSTDIVESVPLAGSPASATAYGISMKVKGEGIEAGKTLEVQYRDVTGAWVSVVSTGASGVNASGYTFFGAVLDAEFGYHSTSVRILANGSDASDVWMIDDFRIEPIGPVGIPYMESFDLDVLSALQWDLTQTTAPIEPSIGSPAMRIDNTIGVTGDIDVTPATDDGGFINFYAANDASGGSDSLSIEYHNFLGSWVVLDTIDSSSLSTTVRTGFSYPIPFFGLHNGFRMRFSDTAATGAFFVDDISIGLDPLSPGCTDADLVEPFGTLNLQDVFAYLALFNAQDPAADIADPIGSFNLQDVFAYLSLFNAGCP